MSLHRLKRSDMAPAVGRDIDNWCSRCKAELAHTILAMVAGQPARVRCNTCGSERNFRRTKAASKQPTRRRVATAAPAGRKPDQQLHRERFERRIAEIDRATCVDYSPRMRALVGQLIEHKVFGYGIVDEVMGTKAMVSFETGIKTLAVNR